jgi:hypothetical protein
MASPDHLSISTTTLADIGDQLRTLHDEFAHSTDITGHHSGDMGSGDVAGALGDFASDWSKKRDQLAGELDALSKTATRSPAPGGCIRTTGT